MNSGIKALVRVGKTLATAPACSTTSIIQSPVAQSRVWSTRSRLSEGRHTDSGIPGFRDPE